MTGRARTVTVAAVAAAVLTVTATILDRLRSTPERPRHAESPRASSSPSESFEHLAQGSEVYPYSWFLALERADSEQPFRAELSRFGLIDQPTSPGNPDDPYQLPIGLTVARHGGHLPPMIGMTCAACHTGRIEYRGQGLTFLGGAGLFDPVGFFDELAGATRATLLDPDKRFRFLKLYLRPDDLLAQILAPYPSREAMAASGSWHRLLLDEIDRLMAREVARVERHIAERPSENKSLQRLHRLAAQGGPEDDYHARLAGHPLVRLEAARIQELQHLETEAARHLHLGRALSHLAADVRLARATLHFLENYATAGFGPQTAAGPGRVDAFGKVRNTLLTLSYGQGAAYPETAPVSFPHLWDVRDIEWLHWNGNTNTVLERNILEALGSGAMVDLEGFASTVRFENLRRLEELTYALAKPSWPEPILGTIDQERAERGRAIFFADGDAAGGSAARSCAACHDRAEASVGERRVMPQFPLAVLGTDPNHATNFARRVAGDSVASDTVTGDNAAGAGFAAIISGLARRVAQSYFDEQGTTPEEQRAWNSDRTDPTWRSPVDAPYPARPLTAVWATAPYLHNGSVPTLYHLLLPSSQRPARFPAGHFEFDPERVGYALDVAEPRFVFDVEATVHDADGNVTPGVPNGNSNRGHEFGTSLSEAERLDLIEYLKTL